MAIYKLTLTFTKGSQSVDNFKHELINNCGSFRGGLDMESGIGQYVEDVIEAAVVKGSETIELDTTDDEYEITRNAIYSAAAEVDAWAQELGDEECGMGVVEEGLVDDVEDKTVYGVYLHKDIDCAFGDVCDKVYRKVISYEYKPYGLFLVYSDPRSGYLVEALIPYHAFGTVYIEVV